MALSCNERGGYSRQASLLVPTRPRQVWGMDVKTMWENHSITFQYALYGALFGLAFPVLSTLGDLYMQQLPLTMKSLLQVQKSTPLHWVIDTAPFFLGLFASFAGKRQDQLVCLNKRLRQGLQERDQAIGQLETLQAGLEKQVAERTADQERLQQEIIDAQRRLLQELSTPIIPVMDSSQGGIIVMPLIGSIDTMRAQDIMRRLLAGIREYRAQVVILDITGVAVVDSGVANHLNKTIQAARLKGTHAIVTGISDAVAETVVDLGIDWGGIETLGDLQTGLVAALDRLGFKLTR